MSLIQFSIESSGEKAIIRDFENRWKQSQNLSKPLEDFANYFEREIKRNFKFHQLGTRKLPVRKMWGVREMDWQELRQQIQKYLFEESR